MIIVEVQNAVGRFNGYCTWAITDKKKIEQYAGAIERDYRDAKRLLSTLQQDSRSFQTIRNVVDGYEKAFGSVLGI
jgi:hypothetical protein